MIECRCVGAIIGGRVRGWDVAHIGIRLRIGSLWIRILRVLLPTASWTTTIKAREASAATRQSATTAADAAPDYRDSNDNADDDANDRRPLAVSFGHAGIPTAERIRRTLDLVDCITIHCRRFLILIDLGKKGESTSW